MSNWVGLVVGAALATAGGLAGGWQSNWLGMKRDKQAQEHERQLASHSIQQERLDRTYTELGIFLARYMDWARSVHPFIGPVPPPAPLPDDERWRIQTLVKNHGSQEVQQLLDEWGEIVQKIQNAEAIIELADGASRSPSLELDQNAQREKHALEEAYRASNAAGR